MIKEYWKGTISDCERKIKLVDNKYVYELSGDFNYQRDTYTAAYDKDGKFLKDIITNSEYFTKEETLIKEGEEVGTVIMQYNFDFIEVPVGSCYSQPEVNEAYRLLKGVFPNLEVQSLSDYKCSDIACMSDKKELDKYKKDRIMEGFRCIYLDDDINEFCILGNTYKICSKNVLSDVKSYKKRVDKAMKKWPKSERMIGYLYNLNIGLLEIRKLQALKK